MPLPNHCVFDDMFLNGHMLTAIFFYSDRPLQHINKKGRPVSQCAHCRAMRKSRSAHIKCDCGEKTSKCAHLQPTVDGHKGKLQPLEQSGEVSESCLLTMPLQRHVAAITVDAVPALARRSPLLTPFPSLTRRVSVKAPAPRAVSRLPPADDGPTPSTQTAS